MPAKTANIYPVDIQRHTDVAMVQWEFCSRVTRRTSWWFASCLFIFCKNIGRPPTLWVSRSSPATRSCPTFCRERPTVLRSAVPVSPACCVQSSMLKIAIATCATMWIQRGRWERGCECSACSCCDNSLCSVCLLRQLKQMDNTRDSNCRGARRSRSKASHRRSSPVCIAACTTYEHRTAMSMVTRFAVREELAIIRFV